jgi:hypothetical protein
LRSFKGFCVFAIFKSWDLGDEANPKSMKEYSDLVVPPPHGRKVGKLLRKNMRKAHFRGREGRKGTNRPRAVGVPVSLACIAGHMGSSKRVHVVIYKWEK